jgi:hypothetical protein
MRFPNGGRPPPARDDAGGGPLIERFPGQLSDKFNPHKRSAQKAQPIPRERLAYLTGRLHRLGPRPLARSDHLAPAPIGGLAPAPIGGLAQTKT